MQVIHIPSCCHYSKLFCFDSLCIGVAKAAANTHTVFVSHLPRPPPLPPLPLPLSRPDLSLPKPISSV